MLSSLTPSWCLESSARWSCRPGRHQRAGATGDGRRLRETGGQGGGCYSLTCSFFPSRSREEMISWMQVWTLQAYMGGTGRRV